MNYDITPIVNSLILLLAAVVTVILIPYIKSKTTETQQTAIAKIIKTAVYGYEQIITGDKMGEQRFEAVIANVREALEKRNITFNYEEIELKIEETVNQMNMEKPPLKE